MEEQGTTYVLDVSSNLTGGSSSNLPHKQISRVDFCRAESVTDVADGIGQIRSDFWLDCFAPANFQLLVNV